jgi:plastocyanin
VNLHGALHARKDRGAGGVRFSMRRLIAMLCAVGLLAAVSAPALGSGTTVKVSGYKFTAKTVHIKKGSTVTWKWSASNDDKHNVTFKGFHSKSQMHGHFSHTFRRKGTFTYVCTFHVKTNGMRGTVVVS